MPTSEPAPDIQFDDMPQQVRAGLMGMWLFLVTELLLFGGLFAAFAVSRIQHPQVFAEAAHHLDLVLGAINTVLLLTSGLFMALSEKAVASGKRRAGAGFLLGTILLGVLFLGVKAFEWYKEFNHQLMPVLDLPFNYPGDQAPAAEMFFNYYFAMTGLHAAHMLLGIIALGVMAVLVLRWREPARLDRQTRILGMYWAFVDVIWIFVFTTLYLMRA